MYGQIVIGPPGSGKTTYCQAMFEFLESTGRRTAIINLDPANENCSFRKVRFSLDILSLVTVKSAMDQLELGPNGSLIFCMEYLEKNLDWLDTELKKLPGLVKCFNFISIF
jgi:GTPase SAR1 family protein